MLVSKVLRSGGNGDCVLVCLLFGSFSFVLLVRGVVWFGVNVLFLGVGYILWAGW